MRKVQFGGKDCEGEVVEFTINDHGKPITLTATDGTIVKLSMLVSELIRVVDEVQENGEPVYLISYTIAQSTIGKQTPVVTKKKIQ